MDTRPITPERLADSVVAVPPLARSTDGQISATENARLIQYLERGGINTLLYGGNAVLYHIRLSEYANLLSQLRASAADTTLIVPSVGPAYGTMMDQAPILKEYDFPTVMILPQKEIADQQGLARGIRHFAEAFGKPIVLYLKHDRWLAPQIVKSLYEDGLISWIKYAVVLDNPAQDDYLREILQVVPAKWIVSGIGEQPAIIHMRDFGVISYTSGCVCVAPKLSMKMLRAVQAKDYSSAESIRAQFRPLEDLRNAIQPIRVLHSAVTSANIANMGPIQPMLGELDAQQTASVRTAALELLAIEQR
ncbi:MAG: dihydrodipicolinate synthase family protein [Pirellulales bacterium]